VPAAAVRFLETDTETKLIAKPQLRGQEGQKITLNLGDEIPVPATVFTPIAGGGSNVNPLTSFNYRTVGVVVEMTPRVTFEDEIILELSVESSSQGNPVSIAGQELPAFGSRKVVTKLRLRDGESNLLAGLLREEERRTMRGIPGLLRLPVLRNLFAANDTEISQTDIVMLLTPRIVRTQEISLEDVSPIFIGSQQSLGLGGPPPLIAPPAGADPDVPAPAVGLAPAPAPPPPAGGGVIVVPPGSSPIPGTTTLPAAPAQPVVPPPAAPGGPAPAGGVSTAPGGGTPPVAVATAATGGQIILSPPGPEFRVGAGPYTVPVSITGASQISGVSLTITFNPAVLRVRAVQEGSFMRTGGIAAAFTQQVDAAAGRIDIAIVRPGDPTGVAGTGLLSAILFDAVGGGPANLTVTGSATSPRGTPMPLQFGPAPGVNVR
jgi:general secretion pathway protein D